MPPALLQRWLRGKPRFPMQVLCLPTQESPLKASEMTQGPLDTCDQTSMTGSAAGPVTSVEAVVSAMVVASALAVSSHAMAGEMTQGPLDTCAQTSMTGSATGPVTSVEAVVSAMVVTTALAVSSHAMAGPQVDVASAPSCVAQ